MILNTIAEKLKRQSKDDFKGRHFEAWLIVQAVGRCQPFFPLIYKILHSCFLRGSAPSAFGGFPRGFLGPQRCSLRRALGFLQCAV